MRASVSLLLVAAVACASPDELEVGAGRAWGEIDHRPTSLDVDQDSAWVSVSWSLGQRRQAERSIAQREVTLRHLPRQAGEPLDREHDPSDDESDQHGEQQESADRAAGAGDDVAGVHGGVPGEVWTALVGLAMAAGAWYRQRIVAFVRRSPAADDATA